MLMETLGDSNSQRRFQLLMNRTFNPSGSVREEKKKSE